VNRFTALLRQRIRRDSVQLLMWMVGAALMAYAGYVGVSESYGTEQDRSSILRAAVANPVILLFRGLPSGSSDGAFIAFQLVPWLAILAAFMSAFLAVRHSRMDEEAGRLELVAATPAGRLLPTAVTIVHGVTANLALGVLVAAAFLAAGLDGAGSLTIGAAAASVGIVFLGVGLLAGQFMRSPRGANSVSMAVLLTTFLFSGIGNAVGTPDDTLQRMESSWLTWLSPFGWAENSRPFDADSWWPIVLAAVVGAVLIAVSVRLQSARDLGASFVAERPGRAEARPTLASNHALVWRLSAPSIVGWAIGGAITGLLATSLSSVIEQIGGENPAIASVLEAIAKQGSLAEGMITTFFIMLGVFCACCAVQTVARARQEEAAGTAEALLATPLGRIHWLADHVLVGFFAIVIVAAAAVGGAAAGMARADDGATLFRAAVVAAGGQVAAASVFLVLTALVFVLAPRFTIPLGWTLVAVGTMLGLFGPLFGLPDWLTDVSPFAGTPVMSDGVVEVNGLWWLAAVAITGAAGALALMRRRGVTSGG
jgi:ABC-2 type transport system permease protein